MGITGSLGVNKWLAGGNTIDLAPLRKLWSSSHRVVTKMYFVFHIRFQYSFIGNMKIVKQKVSPMEGVVASLGLLAVNWENFW